MASLYFVGKFFNSIFLSFKNIWLYFKWINLNYEENMGNVYISHTYFILWVIYTFDNVHANFVKRLSIK